MPELPEVETIRRDLSGELEGRTIRDVTIHQADIVMDGASASDFVRRVRDRRILSLDRRAKNLLFRLEGPLVLQVQIRMTGRFALGPELPDPDEFSHVAAELVLDDGRTLFYDDVRRLGGFRLLSPGAWAEIESGLGPEPLEPEFGAGDLASALAGSRAPVKNCLLDQRRLAGLGNIYAVEVLHRAGLDPRRPGGELEGREIERLHEAIRTILLDALRHAGTTFRDYRAVNGRSGAFQERLEVYARAGAPCSRCGATVERIVQAGRSTYHCPGCQA